MIDKNFLSHIATFVTRTVSGKDSYNKPTYSEVSALQPCFFDVPEKEVAIKFMDRDVVAEGRIFLHKDTSAQVNDKVTKVVDKNGDVIIESDFRIVKVLPVSDDDGIHHLEAFLVTSK